MPTTISFWDIDTQADFVYPNGKLYVPGAETIVSALNRLTEWAGRNGVLIVASADAHREEDAEFAQFPPHCMAGTPGQQKIAETRLPNALVLPNRHVKVPKNLREYPQIIMEKQQLDVFSNPNMDEVLDQLGSNHEVILYGLVTELCVACAARELLHRGYKVSLVTDAIRHLDELKAQNFLAEVSQSGAKLVSTGKLLPELERRQFAGGGST